MELANIEKILEKYFEATTTVQEEQELQSLLIYKEKNTRETFHYNLEKTT